MPAALFLLLLLNGCLSMNTIDGFLKTEEGRGQFKAVSSDGTLLWVRLFDDDYDGDLAFWSDALYNDFVENRGYVLLEKQLIRLDRDSLEGEEMLFEASAQGTLHRYLVCLFVKDGTFYRKICVAEYVAKGNAFDEHLEAVRKAVRSIEF